MTKQEDIFYILQDVRLGELSEYEATLKLQELGVVIKVDRELPSIGGFEILFDEPRLLCKATQQNMLEWHNDSLDPLIKEG